MSLHDNIIVKAAPVIIIIIVVVLYNIKIIQCHNNIFYYHQFSSRITCNGKITIIIVIIIMLVSQCHNKFPLNVYVYHNFAGTAQSQSLSTPRLLVPRTILKTKYNYY